MQGNGSVAPSIAGPHGAASAVLGSRKVYALFTIVENDERSYWRRIGSAFINRDGSYNLVLDAFPVNGRVHMREVDNPPLHAERP